MHKFLQFVLNTLGIQAMQLNKRRLGRSQLESYNQSKKDKGDSHTSCESIG
jgi:hypothetical protein